MGSGEWCTPENRKKGNKNKTAAGVKLFLVVSLLLSVSF